VLVASDELEERAGLLGERRKEFRDARELLIRGGQLGLCDEALHRVRLLQLDDDYL
jgi:hypothetical protein